MRILFAGTPEVGLPSLERLIAAGHQVVGVLTRAPALAGRGRKLLASPIAQRAEELGIEVLSPTHPSDPDFVTRLTDLAPDVCPVVAYGALLPQSVLTIPRFGWVNLHFSVLPRWRGAAPVQRAIMAGDTQIGVTTFEIVKELDAGPIYRRYEQELAGDATAGDILSRLADRGADLLVETLNDIASGITPDAQPNDGITLAAKIEVEDAHLSWDQPAVRLHNQIRGCSPDPGAWTMWRDQRFKILRSSLATASSRGEGSLKPGELEISKRQVLIGTAEGVLELVEVQPLGKKPMPAADWGRGAVSSGEVLR